MATVIQFPVIPRKTADRRPALKRYRCINCGIEALSLGEEKLRRTVICQSWGGCGAEMRLVEVK